MERRLAAILAADVVGYSRLIRADEEGTLSALKSLRGNLIDPTLGRNGGRVVKLMGDGMLVEFPSVVDAVRAAVEIQQAVAEHNAVLPVVERIVFRVGVNLGDVVIDGDDIHGDGVNVAARLEGLAQPGGVCVSGGVYEQVRDRLAFVFADMGEQAVKNIDRPVRAWHWSATAATPGAGAGLSAAPPPDRPSIAVLPFDNMSGDEEQEYFADGISEDIITSLSKVSGLLVIARNSSFVYRGQATNVKVVAKELGVEYVLEGSVRKAGNRVRISAQLIEHKTGGHIWAERFDRELTDIFAVQDEVTREIVSALAVQLTSDEMGRMTTSVTENPDAYDYFLRGREQYWLFTRDGVAQAHGLLRKAIELDANFAPSYAFLSHARINQHVNRWHEEADRPLDEAYVLARQSVALDPKYPKAHSALGNTYLWRRQHDLSIDEYLKALALDPNFSLGFMELGRAYHYAGRSSEAIELIRRAMQLDPHYPDIYLHTLAQAYFHCGDFDTAADLLNRRLVRKPDTDISRVLLASSLGHLGRLAEAREMWAEALRVNPGYSLAHRRQVLPYKDPADFDLITDGLDKAGVGE